MKKNPLKDPAYEDRFIDWLLSEYTDETQLLKPQELQNRLASINNKVLINEENLFIIQSILKVYRKQLKLTPQIEQKLIIIMLNFVEKAQKEQLKKIDNAHEVAGRILLFTRGDATVANTIFRTLLNSETLLKSSYLDNLTLWLASHEQDQSQLLKGEQLKLALTKFPAQLTEIENKFLIRSLVFNLRGKNGLDR